MSGTRQILKVNADNREATFNAAYDGSYYTILGCAGDLSEWTAEYQDDGAGLPFLKKMNPNAGSKTVDEMRDRLFSVEQLFVLLFVLLRHLF